MIFDWLYPRRCPVCEDIVMPKGRLVCKECESKIPYVGVFRCYRCGKELENERQEYCYDCLRHLQKKDSYFEQGLVPLKYNLSMRRSMEKLKYSNKREYAEFFADCIIRVHGESIKAWDAELLIPVPIHRRRMIKRGYNQAALIAKHLNKYLQLELREDVLVRIKNTKVQNKLNDKDRKRNVTEAFSILENVVQYKKVILVDDIYTTGSTINSCAQILKAAGALQVYSVCACIGSGF